LEKIIFLGLEITGQPSTSSAILFILELEKITLGGDGGCAPYLCLCFYRQGWGSASNLKRDIFPSLGLFDSP
jgi:hypothetical protein